ncbi:hypothetical protein GLAREA_06825 [Glarea lozoyensis ATCC 20868]|uniref:Uncharacterized protein n=1 Tax=Glarea lozoyensis (strain ATCC 20868 / MF5171) TaxID=1116229 RepID=S3D5V0_GLAL2|nr:uncharacterized protein GLAREA_06825 [Glarea lozoyensis ATCC 20868]EPE33812.1 hypothetical protein GLAREA_06825 [Glarea lozoyensis ATCC 20868]
MPPPSPESGSTNDPARSQRINALKTTIETLLTYDPEALKQYYPDESFLQNRDRFEVWYRREHVQLSQIQGKLKASLGKYADIFGYLTIEERVFAGRHYAVNEWDAQTASREFELYIKDKDGKLVEKAVWSHSVETPRVENEVKESFGEQKHYCA